MRLSVILFLLALFPSTRAFALAGDWQRTSHIGVRLVSADEAVGDDKSFMAAVQLDLQHDWYSYWRMPGEGGLPPAFDWSKSENIKSVKLSWPLPERIDMMGLYSFGYRGMVYFPLEVAAADLSKPVKLNLKADIMVCHDLCIPNTFQISMTVPPGKAVRAPDAYQIQASRLSVPHDGDLPGLKIESAVLGPDALVVKARSKTEFGKPEAHTDLFIEVKDGKFYFTARPEILPDAKDPRIAILKIAGPEGSGDLTKSLMGRSVTFILSHDGMSIEKTIVF